MKIFNLEVGKEYKNYKELCGVLEIPVTGGDTKKKNIKELQRHVKYHNKGYRFIIDEIYNVPKPKKDGRGRHGAGAYNKFIKVLITHMLAQEPNNIIISGRQKMIDDLNMVNQNFKYGRYNKEKLANYLKIDIKFINEFFETNSKKLNSAVESSLNQLMNNDKSIFWSNVKVIDNIKGEHREATKKETTFVVNCEKETLKDMSMVNMNQVYALNREAEYQIKAKEKLNEKGINYAYNAYKIIFADDVYEQNKQLNYRLEIDEEEFNKSELNATVDIKFNESVESRYEKNKKKVGFGNVDARPRSEYTKIVEDEDFVESNKKLISTCIDDISDSISKVANQKWDEKELKSENNI